MKTRIVILSLCLTGLAISGCGKSSDDAGPGGSTGPKPAPVPPAFLSAAVFGDYNFVSDTCTLGERTVELDDSTQRTLLINEKEMDILKTISPQCTRYDRYSVAQTSPTTVDYQLFGIYCTEGCTPTQCKSKDVKNSMVKSISYAVNGNLLSFISDEPKPGMCSDPNGYTVRTWIKVQAL